MLDFTFYSPTEFVFGKETETKTGQLAKKYGASRVLIAYGGGSAVRSGLLDRVKAALDAEGLSYAELGGIQPNPTEGKVYEGIDIVRKENINFLLAVGGGSVIDTVKAIACGVYYDGDFWDFFIGQAKVTKAMPLGVVLTIPAAGSEGSGNSVITNSETKQKLGIKHPMILRPRFSVMNPQLTVTLPAYQTASGICDMMVHVLERYFTNTPNTEVGDRMCEAVLMTCINEGRKVMAHPDDYDARANIMWCGTVAHNGTCGVGCEEDWSGHQMEHELSAMFGVTHGAGLAVITPAYMTFMAENNPDRIIQFAKRVFGITEDDLKPTSLAFNDEDTAIALEGISRFKKFLHDDLGLPITLGQLLPNLSDEEITEAIPALVENLHKNKGETFGAFYPITREVSEQIYTLAM